GILMRALVDGKPELSFRLRAELVDQSNLRFAEAYTTRLRLGFGTGSWHGLSGFAELEDVRAFDSDLYNAGGFDGNPSRAVVADVPDTELNQLFARYESELTASTYIVGRQRIVLDDHRFVGDVGWRQNEQTYDAASIESSLGIDPLTVLYVYLWEVNRVFGPDAGADFDSEDRKSTRLNSSHVKISYAVFCLKKKTTTT